MEEDRPPPPPEEEELEPEAEVEKEEEEGRTTEVWVVEEDVGTDGRVEGP